MRVREVAAVKHCPQCGEPFGCGHGQPGCWCEEVLLSAETLTRLRTVADDCLCPACLSGYAEPEATRADAEAVPVRLRWAKAVPDAAVQARGLPPLWALAAVAFLLGSLLLALANGPLPIGAGAIAESALAHLPLVHVRSPLGAMESAIVWQVRAPRVVLGALVGGMLAIAGASYQGVFRNPLADPYLLGVAAGAGLGATLAIAYTAPGAHVGELLPLAAFAGAVCAVAGAYVLGRSVGGVRTTGALILAGVTVAAFMTAIQTFVQQQHSDTLREVYSWILGGLSGASWQQVVLVTPYITFSVAVLLVHRRVLDVLSLGDEEAAGLGLNVRRTRLVIVAAATAGTAAAVAVSGLIGFVGIIVPHTVRLLVSSSYRAIVPLSLLVGAGFLVLTDVLARTVMSPAELPIGVVTAFFGAPFFAVLLRTSRRVGM
ncbi:MAG TPA: cysteine-rich CWC family protein [Gaiellales bacterium]|nr:cysteine-rich CWC family protein [Gaiellales bacterium]